MVADTGAIRIWVCAEVRLAPFVLLQALLENICAGL